MSAVASSEGEEDPQYFVFPSLSSVGMSLGDHLVLPLTFVVAAVV